MVLESYLRDMASEFYVDPEEDSEGADQRRFTQLEKNQPGWPSIGGDWIGTVHTAATGDQKQNRAAQGC